MSNSFDKFMYLILQILNLFNQSSDSVIDPTRGFGSYEVYITVVVSIPSAFLYSVSIYLSF